MAYLRRFGITAALAAALVWGLTPGVHESAAIANRGGAGGSVRDAAAEPALRWVPPVGALLVVSGPYRAPPHRYGSGHRGVDLPATPGTPVVAPAAGTVTFAGTVVDRPVVTVRVTGAEGASGDILVSMEPVSATRAVGETVRAGEVLGAVATGGHCAAECVHVGVRVDGEYVNPLRFFRAKPRLLPW